MPCIQKKKKKKAPIRMWLIIQLSYNPREIPNIAPGGYKETRSRARGMQGKYKWRKASSWLPEPSLQIQVAREGIASSSSSLFLSPYNFSLRHIPNKLSPFLSLRIRIKSLSIQLFSHLKEAPIQILPAFLFFFDFPGKFPFASLW